MSQSFRNTLHALRTDPEYVARRDKNLPAFPAIDCPPEIKEALAALCGPKRTMAEFLDTRRGALGNKTLRQLLEKKEFRKLEKFIQDFFIVDTDGPGAL